MFVFEMTFLKDSKERFCIFVFLFVSKLCMFISGARGEQSEPRERACSLAFLKYAASCVIAESMIQAKEVYGVDSR